MVKQVLKDLFYEILELYLVVRNLFCGALFSVRVDKLSDLELVA